MSTKKPADMMPTKKLGEMVLLKPCETMSTKKPADTMLIKPCETIPERSIKKRRVISSVVVEDEDKEQEDEEMENEEKEEEEEEEEEEEADDDDDDSDDDDDYDDDEGMKPDSEAPSHVFEQGKHVDVKALLSTETRNFLVTTKGGEIVPIASLDGKHVLVCCFLVPFQIDSPEASVCRSIEALYSELSLKGIADDVKLVAVAKIATGFDNADFDRFFSKLSVDCLAIPFSDSVSRDKICEALGLRPQSISRQVPCLAVHPNGKVLQFNPYFLDEYGAESFPFTKEHFVNIKHQDEIIRNSLRSTDSPISLSEFLQCDRLSRIADENNSVPTSDLGDTVVALYLYFDGYFMVKLQEIHQKCLDQGHKFEIILVPLPFDRHYDPASFYNLMKQSVLKSSQSSSWLVFPFNDKICRTLWRLFHCYSEDQLIILPHGDCRGDLCGKRIATLYEIDAYPFTRDVIIERKVSRIRSITLEQLLGDSHVSDFRNKNVLLYLDYPTFGNGNRNLFKRLKKDYRGIKVNYPDAEVVFVPLEPVFEPTNSRMSEMKWHILPYYSCKSVMKHIYGNGIVYPTLVSIGKDGKILSLSAQYNLHVSDSFASLFDDTLASEILGDLEEDMW